MTIIGPITGPDSLRQVGMKGFAVGPPRCTLALGACRRRTGRHAAMVARARGAARRRWPVPRCAAARIR